MSALPSLPMASQLPLPGQLDFRTVPSADGRDASRPVNDVYCRVRGAYVQFPLGSDYPIISGVGRRPLLHGERLGLRVRIVYPGEAAFRCLGGIVFPLIPSAVRADGREASANRRGPWTAYSEPGKLTCRPTAMYWTHSVRMFLESTCRVVRPARYQSSRRCGTRPTRANVARQGKYRLRTADRRKNVANGSSVSAVSLCGV